MSKKLLFKIIFGGNIISQVLTKSSKGPAILSFRIPMEFYIYENNKYRGFTYEYDEKGRWYCSLTKKIYNSFTEMVRELENRGYKIELEPPVTPEKIDELVRKYQKEAEKHCGVEYLNE